MLNDLRKQLAVVEAQLEEAYKWLEAEEEVHGQADQDAKDDIDTLEDEQRILEQLIEQAEEAQL